VKSVEEKTHRGFIPGLVGSHPSMLALCQEIRRSSRLRSNVLILGESGTGKELVARAIHQQGPWAAEPFIGVNCGAFARNLLDDQLFGHVRGAFTGAVVNQQGVFVAAGKGTLFLDEIAEIDIDLQGKLLRAIQEREVIPLGTNRAVPWKARLITATNRDLESLIQEGRFRRDLYYRINILQLRTTPLRERPEDIPALVDFFLEELAGEQGRLKRISPEALKLLVGSSFPGNVRELRNAVERACALGASEQILPEDLPRELQTPTGEGFKTLAQIEREHILRALRMARGQKKLAARFLEIDRNRLNRKIKKHGIAAAEIQRG
jgi:DNA-binding NtrC family response regulator